MNFVKRNLGNIPSCYSVSQIPIAGKDYILFASDADEACLAFEAKDLSNCHTIWEHPGGTMGMVPIPGRDGEFLAVQKFYRLWDWEEAQLVWCRYSVESGCETTVLCTLPYLHRFDMIERDGKLHLIMCCVAEHKTSLNDWSSPGPVYAAILPESPEEGIELSVLHKSLYKNHGYSRVIWQGTETAFITCDNGAYLFTPPGSHETAWSIKKLMDGHFSDGDMIDMDGDGKLEIATIEAFHGDSFCVYKEVEDQYKKIYEYPEKAEFCHVVKAAVINGIPGFIGGCRGGRAQMFFLYYDHKEASYVSEQIDEGGGPCNAICVNVSGQDIIFAANNNAGEATAYLSLA